MTLSDPIAVQERLEQVEQHLELALFNAEDKALAWFRAKRDREVMKARVYAESEGPATERKILADAAAAQVGCVEEAEWEAAKMMERLLQAKANVGMAILKAQARA